MFAIIFNHIRAVITLSNPNKALYTFYLIFLLSFANQLQAASINVNEDDEISFLVNKYVSGTGWSFFTNTAASHGAVSQPMIESIKYKPNVNYCGSDQFTYTVRKSTSGGGPLNLTPENQIDSIFSDPSNSSEDQVSLIDASNDEEVLAASYTYSTVTIDVNVVCLNDLPTISSITGQPTNEDIAKTVVFTVSDVETPAGSLTLTATSSNTTLLPVSNISFGGSGGSRSVTMTPAANQSGSVTVTLTVKDANNATATRSFVLTVTAVNDVPTISSIAAQSTNKNVAKTVSFTVSDAETAAGSLTLTATSSNATLLPVGNISFGGSGGSRSVTMTPAANQSGSVTITLTVKDASNATATSSFTLTVNAAPTISSIAAQSTNKNVAKTVSFTVSDVETAAGSLTLTAASSNATLLPASNISFGGSGGSRSVTMTPAANQSGSVTVTLTVKDANNATATSSFVLAVNAAPTISSIAAQSTNKNVAKTVSFTVSDAETAAGSLTLTAASSNATLLPTSNISFGGSGGSRSVTMTPAANQSGSVTVTLTVKDANNATATSSFVLAVNTAPTISSIAAQSTEKNVAKTVSFTVSDAETAAGSLTLTATSSNATLLPVGNISFGGSGGSRSVTMTPAANQSGSVTITLTVKDASNATATSSFTLTVNATTPSNQAVQGSVWINGSPIKGNTLTVSNNLTDGNGLGAFSYRWKRNGSNISGATSTSYILVQADVGSKISIAISFTDGDGYAESVTSSQTPTVTVTNTPPTGSVTIEGDHTVGTTLTATNTISDPDGLGTFTYQWLRNGVNIAGATSDTYTLTSDDVGYVISVKVSYADGGGTTESVSSSATPQVIIRVKYTYDALGRLRVVTDKEGVVHEYDYDAAGNRDSVRNGN